MCAEPLRLLGGRQEPDEEEGQQQAPDEHFAVGGDLRPAYHRDVDPDRVLVARRDTGPVRLDRGVAEPVGEVTGRTARRAAGEPVAAVRAHQPVERGVHHAPVVPVGFGHHHLGQTAFLVPTGDVPLPQEDAPPLLHDGVHQPTAPPARGRPAVLVSAALLATPQHRTDLGTPHAAIVPQAGRPGKTDNGPGGTHGNSTPHGLPPARSAALSRERCGR